MKISNIIFEFEETFMQKAQTWSKVQVSTEQIGNARKKIIIKFNIKRKNNYKRKNVVKYIKMFYKR